MLHLLLFLSHPSLPLVLKRLLALLYYLLSPLVKRWFWVFFIEEIALGICNPEGTQVLELFIQILLLYLKLSDMSVVRPIQPLTLLV